MAAEKAVVRKESRMRNTRPKLGLALGSGAARGMAHIGVLRALAEVGMAPDIVAGTSIGALVGGVYAAGKLDELTDIVLELDWKQVARYFVEMSFPRSGLIEGVKVTEFLERIVGRREIAELAVIFRAVAADVNTGREVVIGEGPLVAAIRASISVPGIFTPAERQGALLVDGGLVNPVPVSVCRAMGAEQVVAVDLNYGRLRRPQRLRVSGRREARKSDLIAGGNAGKMFEWLDRKMKHRSLKSFGPVRAWMERRSMPSIFEVLGSSLCIIEEQIAVTRLKIDRPDILIRPRVGHVRFMEFFLARETIEEGYRATVEALAKHKNQLSHVHSMAIAP